MHRAKIRLQPGFWLALSLATGSSFAAPVNYEMNLITTSGLGAGGTMSTLGMLFGGKSSSATRSMELRLDNPTDIPDDYRATHTVPAAMRIGPQLPLTGQRRGRGDGEERPADSQPEGRVLIYWGCSTTIAKGQPEIIDFKALAARVPPEVLAMARQSRSAGHPASGTRTSLPPRTLSWPWGDENFRDIPDEASAVGEHVVTASFMPQEIRYTLDANLDFLEPMGLKTTAGNTRAAIPLAWQILARARGYDLHAVGQSGKKEMVLWLAAKGKSPMLPGRQHECTIPEGVFAKSSMTMVAARAFGPLQGFAYPPQKPGEKKPLIWTVKVRITATDGLVVGMQDAAAGAAKESARDSAMDAVAPAGVGGVLKGLFGH